MQDVSAEKDIFKNKVFNKFSRNLTSMLARSSLTSPGAIRANILRKNFFQVFLESLLSEALDH
jgi:hypothetical protein